MSKLQLLWLFGAGVTVALIAARILKPLINYFENYLFERQTRKRVAEMRHGGRPKEPVRVRQTDITTNMKAADRTAYRRAEALLAAGSIKDAAAIFESIKFQRKAIDVLEAAGLIDDACGVLMRINAVGRAGVLFERNHMFDKAAHCFTQAGQHEAAGKAYLRLAAKDYRFFGAASEAFAKSEKWDAMLNASAEILATAKVVETALAQGKSEFLAYYFANTELALDVLPRLSADQIGRWCAALPLTPRNVLNARGWAKSLALPHLDVALLNYVHSNKELCTFFWAGLNAETKQRLAEVVKSTPALSDSARAAHLPFVELQTPMAQSA